MSATDFYVCEYDPMTGEHGIIPGENCFEWLEADEVADHFRSEHNGSYYYVGDKDGNPVTCPQAEIDETNAFDKELGIPVPSRAVRRAMYINFLATAKELTHE